MFDIVDAVSLDAAIRAIKTSSSTQIAWTLPARLTIDVKKRRKRVKKLKLYEKQLKEAFAGKQCIQLSLKNLQAAEEDMVKTVCSIVTGYVIPEVTPFPIWDVALLDIFLRSCDEIGSFERQDNSFLYDKWPFLSLVKISSLTLSLFDKKMSRLLPRMDRVVDLELSFIMTGKGVSLPTALKAILNSRCLKRLTLDLTTEDLISAFFSQFAVVEQAVHFTVCLNILTLSFKYFGLVAARHNCKPISRISWNRSAKDHSFLLNLKEKVSFRFFFTTALRSKENIDRLLSFLSRVRSTNFFNYFSEKLAMCLNFAIFPPVKRKSTKKK